ncbi:hypothetical protein I5M32_07685 [Pedobacter sp. SD-b]|uniref:DUF4625 domain-containing protein n=1 Tax=Pedobacter segetis TaxID=2793069 RepID=A0ABS1BKU3_9SPHI|nr:hypothetical protein [Pedobacter segetis]MBK0382839.1 hypothetical protein [Pedobacter segetis]
MKHLKFIAILALGAITFSSCSKNNDAPSNGDGKNVKFTFTVTGVNPAEIDNVSFIAVGGNSTNDKTIWKVNGVTKNNEQDISLGEDDFTGSTKTYVVESIKPLTSAQISLQCINFDAPYKISYKAEVNGKVENDDENITVDVNKDYTHQYSY